MWSDSDLSAGRSASSIGYGKLSQQVTKLVPQEDQKTPSVSPGPTPQAEPRARGTEGVLVKGVTKLAVRLSRCCSPVPGDDIVGYITRGRGVSIHRRDCPNVGFLAEEPDRAVPVEWDSVRTDGAYPVELEIEAVDGFADIKIVIANPGRASRSQRGLARDSAVIDIVVNTRTTMSAIS